MKSSPSYHILLLADTGHHTGCLSDHIQGMIQNSPHHWYVENTLTCKVLHKLDLSSFDAIGFHYSIRPHHPYYVPPLFYEAVKKFNGLKFMFLQDEYHHVNAVEDCALDLNIHLMFTLVKQEFIQKAYPRLQHLRIVPILTGYVPEKMVGLPTLPIKERTLDIFYRSRINEYWLGELAQEKVFIAENTKKLAPLYQLNIDVSVREEDRIYGEKWLDALRTTKAVLATESGASIWDYDGTIEKETRFYLRQHPKASFKEVQNAVLKPYENNLLYSAISPRIFEAAALKTPLIMFPGEYNGICKPERHYISLNKDFSNFKEVAEKLKDVDYLESLAHRTYEDLILSRQYSEIQLMGIVNKELESFLSQNPLKAPLFPLTTLILETKKKYKTLNFIYSALAEIRFIFRNGYKLLMDDRYSIKEKISNLFQGAHRYLVYIFPRYLRR